MIYEVLCTKHVSSLNPSRVAKLSLSRPKFDNPDFRFLCLDPKMIIFFFDSIFGVCGVKGTNVSSALPRQGNKTNTATNNFFSGLEIAACRPLMQKAQCKVSRPLQMRQQQRPIAVPYAAQMVRPVWPLV